MFFSLFLFHLLVPLTLILIIHIFYSLNCTSLLLHLITAHLVSHLSFSSLFSLYHTLIIDVFYFLNQTLLLLDLIITHLVNTFFLTSQNFKLFGKKQQHFLNNTFQYTMMFFKLTDQYKISDIYINHNSVGYMLITQLL